MYVIYCLCFDGAWRLFWSVDVICEIEQIEKMPPQVFRVIRCYKCGTFQVEQVKISNKWKCKICGEAQSLKKVALCYIWFTLLFTSLVLGGECRSASAALLIYRLGAHIAKKPSGMRSPCACHFWKKWNDQHIVEDVKCSPVFLSKNVH